MGQKEIGQLGKSDQEILESIVLATTTQATALEGRGPTGGRLQYTWKNLIGHIFKVNRSWMFFQQIIIQEISINCLRGSEEWAM